MAAIHSSDWAREELAMSVPGRGQVTELLLRAGDGDSTALDRLVPLVYPELRAVAARAMRRERAGHTLDATALVHEAYLRLVDQERARWTDRAQFFRVAAEIMRRILVDHARARGSRKRGGGRDRLSLTQLDPIAPPAAAAPIDILALDEALTRLTGVDPQQARVAELRFFAGLEVEDAAAALGISTSTVKRDWTVARAWLRRELGG
jgi:RNA polymerase sigma factor (TIGR02999 family)